jgi:hypothetical protein
LERSLPADGTSPLTLTVHTSGVAVNPAGGSNRCCNLRIGGAEDFTGNVGGGLPAVGSIPQGEWVELKWTGGRHKLQDDHGLRNGSPLYVFGSSPFKVHYNFAGGFRIRDTATGATTTAAVRIQGGTSVRAGSSLSLTLSQGSLATNSFPSGAKFVLQCLRPGSGSYGSCQGIAPTDTTSSSAAFRASAKGKYWVRCAVKVGTHQSGWSPGFPIQVT